MITNNYCLGIDYSTSNIYIASSDGKSAYSIPVYKKASATVQELQRRFLDESIYFGCKKVGIERPWSFNNPMTSMQMTRIATIIEVAAGFSELETYMVYPKTWRKEIYGTISPHIKRNELKAMAITWAGDHGLTSTDDNICEAYCIANYIQRVCCGGVNDTTSPPELRLHQ